MPFSSLFFLPFLHKGLSCLLNSVPLAKEVEGLFFLAPVLLPLTYFVVTISIGKLTFPKE